MSVAQKIRLTTNHKASTFSSLSAKIALLEKIVIQAIIEQVLCRKQLKMTGNIKKMVMTLCENPKNELNGNER